MTQSMELVRQIQEVANLLKKAAVWNGSLGAVDSDTNDYVYELLCYFKVALIAKSAFNLKIAGNVVTDRKGLSTARWPRKPGLKKNFAYIQLDSPTAIGDSMQLCPGIRVEDKHGKKRAPDINLFKGDTPDDPRHIHMHAFWDAKFTNNTTGPLPDIAVSDFAYTFQQFGAPLPPPAWTTVAHKPFALSGILTNGKQSSEMNAALSEYGIIETSEFPDAPKTRP
jgi:hypothetical protein